MYLYLVLFTEQADSCSNGQTAGLSQKFSTGGWPSVDRLLCIFVQVHIINTRGEGKRVMFEWLIKSWLGITWHFNSKFQLAVSLEPFDWFWCFNFWVKALDVYLCSGSIAGTSDPYNRQKTQPQALVDNPGQALQNVLCMCCDAIRSVKKV